MAKALDVIAITALAIPAYVGPRTQAGASEWHVKYFKDVRIHRGSERHTIQVAWRHVEPLCEAVISFFRSVDGRARLISSGRLGLASAWLGADYVMHKRSGIGLLAVHGEGTYPHTTVFVIDAKTLRPKEIGHVNGGDIRRLKDGVLIENSVAKYTEMYQKYDTFEPFSRTLTFSVSKMRFMPGPWRHGHSMERLIVSRNREPSLPGLPRFSARVSR